jgi:transposase
MTERQPTKKFSPEVRQRAVRMVLEHRGEHASEWASIGSIAGKIGCTAETLRSWVRQAQRDASCRSGRVASVRQACRARQHHDRAAARQMSRAEPAGERVGVHARQLALEPGVHLLRQPGRPLLRRLDQARRSALEDHVTRPARLGAPALIRESWYNLHYLAINELSIEYKANII